MNKKYTCVVPYTGAYNSYDIGEVVRVTGVTSQRDSTFISLRKISEPNFAGSLPLDAFQFCFEEKL